ncbi:MAG: anti-sigma factor [Planctomycetota bacterium]
MPESHDEFFDLCAGYALESLDAEEHEQLEAHLAAGCPLCEAVLPRFRSTVTEMGAVIDPVTPDARTKAQILAAIRATDARTITPRARRAATPTTPATSANRTPRRWPTWLGWSGWGAAAIFAIVAYVGWNDRQQARSDLDGARAALTELENQVRQEALWGSVMTARDSEIVVLLPTAQGSPELHARVTYDPTSERAVIVFENLSAPADRDYQLWAIRDGSPQSLGLIDAVSGGYAVVRLESIGADEMLSAFAVSIEDKGGSKSAAPEGDVIMVGSREN